MIHRASITVSIENRKTMAILTEEEFSKHVGTEFYAKVGEREERLTLAEVKGYMPEPTEEQKMERFSLFFNGPADSVLPQQNFQMRHDLMGEFDMFLVPIRPDEKGCRYEAVFNYFKS
jgi:uncharacterized protein DUF6916